jgi:hypothetical protein
MVMPPPGVLQPWASVITQRLRDHPWQNGHTERLIGSNRRECLDHIVVFGDAHLRRILGAYTIYYNELRTHVSLDEDSPAHRPIQRLGHLTARPLLGGLHHQYCRCSSRQGQLAAFSRIGVSRTFGDVSIGAVAVVLAPSYKSR